MAIEIDKLISSIVYAVAQAKTQVDISTLKVINLYKEHKLLRLFPVPVINIDYVDIEIKAVITEIEETDEDADEEVKKVIGETAQTKNRRQVEKAVEEAKNILRKKGVLYKSDIVQILKRKNLINKDIKVERANEPVATLIPKVKVSVTQDELRESDDKAILTVRMRVVGDELELPQED